MSIMFKSGNRHAKDCANGQFFEIVEKFCCIFDTVGAAADSDVKRIRSG